MKTMALRSRTSTAPWIIPRTAMSLKLSSSACITRNMTNDPKYKCCKDANKESKAVGRCQFYKLSRSPQQDPEVICQKINFPTYAT